MFKDLGSGKSLCREDTGISIYICVYICSPA